MRLVPLSLVAAFLGGLAWYYWLGCTSLVGLPSDDVVYMVLGQSLAAGAGLRELDGPGHPLHVGWPPLYPAFLALVWALFPRFDEAIWAAKALNVLLAVAAVALTWFLARARYGLPRWQAGWAAGALALGTFHATMVDLAMADLLFSVCVLGALAVLETPEGPRPRGAGWLALGALMVLPAWCRTVGLSFAGAAVAWLWLRRGPRVGLVAGLAAAVCYLPWPLYVALAPHFAPTSWTYGGLLRDHGPWEALATLATNLRLMAFDHVHLAVTPLWQHPAIGGGLAAVGAGWLLGAAAWGLIGLGLWRLGRQGVRLLHLFLPLYGGMIGLYPWDPSRYVLAVSALLLIPFVHGVAAAWEAVPATDGRRWKRALAAAWVACWGLGTLGGGIRLAGTLRKPAHHDALLAPWQQEWATGYGLAAAWIRGHLPPGAVLLSTRPPLLYLLAGIERAECCDGPRLTEEARAYLSTHEVYALLAPAPEFMVRHYAFHRAHPELFELRHRVPGGGLALYRLHPPPATATRNDNKRYME